MCVLTYIPTGNDNYLLTNNRDESPTRPSALSPAQYLINEQAITFPKDPLGGGTWIAHNNEKSVVLLNGGHTIHTHKPPYRQSRGLVVLDFFQFETPIEFYEKFEFEGIEPFTLVTTGKTISEIRWDEDGKTFKEFDSSQPKIWSSVTLYTPAIIQKREDWFLEFLNQNPFPTKETALDFHKNGGDGDDSNSLKMNRGEVVKTLGISQIISHNGNKEMTYLPV
ncbi:Transport and Golgi organisation 2 [Spirosomataceae bacterium TFI 002]|nr:Transport and Golgi organisation 2 [Spirosomataceae bacterium TFI 002]